MILLLVGNINSALANASNLCPQNRLNQSFCGHFFGICSGGIYIVDFAEDIETYVVGTPADI